ncbi:MAG: zinc ribbon domain-containing protein [Clostridia bacterium]|nr:zinc ribbon domain-containing protein [Clostridia bacterium]
MPLTSYCKKCGQDVPVASFCPNCRAKLAANTVRLAWCVDHHPVRDWMCWNSVMRLLLPVLGMTLLLVILLEAIMGGLDGVSMLLGGGLIVSLMGIMGMILAVMLLVFILQGDDLLDCVIDSRGIHVQQYLPNPTALKLLLRGKSPRMLESGEDLLLVSSREIAWKDIQRVQLWPEKSMILFYAPKWWMRVSLPCTPFTWEDALSFIRDKIGKKKTVILPEECRQTAPVKAKSAKPARTHQLTFEEVAAEFGGPPDEPALPENVSPEVTGELESDFTSLSDVLQEIKESDNA